MTEEVPVDDVWQQRRTTRRSNVKEITVTDRTNNARSGLKSGSDNDNRFFLPSFFIQLQHEATTLHLHVYPHHTVAPQHIAIVMAYGTCN